MVEFTSDKSKGDGLQMKKSLIKKIVIGLGIAVISGVVLSGIYVLYRANRIVREINNIEADESTIMQNANLLINEDILTPQEKVDLGIKLCDNIDKLGNVENDYFNTSLDKERESKLLKKLDSDDVFILNTDSNSIS